MVEEKIKEAIKNRDCETILELLDEYLEQIEDEEKLREALKEIGEAAVECEDFDIIHEISHLYEHLGEPEKGIELYKKIVERRKGDKEKYAEALYYLAEEYEHMGMPEEALKIYQELLEIEKELGNEREIALTLANIAVVKDELGEADEAIKLMSEAKDIFEKINDTKNYHIALIDLAHFYYELGEYEKAMQIIEEVLRNPLDDEIEVHGRLVESEIHSALENYKKAALSLRNALLRSGDDEYLFETAFEAVLEFIEELYNEEKYAELKEVASLFAELFEDDTKFFFQAIEKLAEWKLGKEEAKKEFEELYNKIENEEMKEFLDELKKPKVNLSL
ncbi:tetratricopeptide repeat protein [Pyrococcus furiosus DSM 3638]|uniref:Tetratricopeptide repeat protein n=3 Tax=Pyrococcus furiosus TaxID=2261 RepID=A0A5C0XS19_PYRFU|nr:MULTISPECIES: tetratricopeptide repeat protein [Pyrococcus]AAL82090.1 hypothetical protein PF1966 [Pyrococcus furiosus DSM 3638]AFN04675.1 hypothetical protein PFC_08750 [Pyrococcus furiosus COM1]MDK2869371.1 hypothetical protein [Pyrococcus sp.]QEK79561.1 tetratricopeptide repeat protein [Pyrococcus furiosus DSM 3638]